MNSFPIKFVVSFLSLSLFIVLINGINIGVYISSLLILLLLVLICYRLLLDFSITLSMLRLLNGSSIIHFRYDDIHKELSISMDNNKLRWNILDGDLGLLVSEHLNSYINFHYLYDGSCTVREFLLYIDSLKSHGSR